MKTKIKIILITLITFYFFTLQTINCFAQVPQSFNYQLIARDTSGKIISNHSLGIKISILKDADNGIVVYSENHNKTTSNFGLVNLEIGKGNIVTGNFNTIEWGNHTHFLKLEIDPAGGTNYYILGITQLISVPYALHAKTVDNNMWTPNGTKIFNNNSGFVGIGTNEPTSALHVNGSVRITDESEGSGRILTSDSLGNASWQIPAIDNSTGTANYIPKFTGNNSLGNSMVYETENKMGIGTKTPTGRVVIKGDSLANDSVPLFEVQDKSGNTVLVVWPDGVHVYVSESVNKANNKGSFAVSGKSTAKGVTAEYLSVNSDSISATKSLYIPRLTTVERDNLGFTPSEALIIFNTTHECMEIYKNGVWSNIWCFHCAPSIITQPLNATLCEGQGGSFTITATGTGLTYQWQYSPNNGNTWFDISNGGTAPVYSGANSFTLTLANVPVNYNNFQYRCNVVASCQPGSISNAAILYVGSESLAITQQPVNQYYSSDCGASFTVATSAYATYQWQENNADISNGGNNPSFSGVATATLSLFGLPSSYNGTSFRCIVSSVCASTLNSTSATLAYQPTPIATNASNITHTSFTANWMPIPDATVYYIDISASPSFSGFLNGFNGLNVGITTNYNIDGLLANSVYYYRVRAKTSCGNEYLVNSNTITVTTTAFYLGENYGGGIIFYIEGSGHNGSTSSTSDLSQGFNDWNNANTACANWVYNGYDDWVLPDIGELDQMCVIKNEIGNWAGAFSYWSTTQDTNDQNNVLVQRFTDCLQFSVPKGDYSPTNRCIRHF